MNNDGYGYPPLYDIVALMTDVECFETCITHKGLKKLTSLEGEVAGRIAAE